jgi:hypothetical protein
LQGQLEAYWADQAKYPCLVSVTATCTTDLNDATWRTANMKGLDPAALADPKNAGTQTLSGSPGLGAYSYETTPASCDNAASATDCTNYTLTATLESGGTFVVKSNN